MKISESFFFLKVGGAQNFPWFFFRKKKRLFRNFMSFWADM